MNRPDRAHYLDEVEEIVVGYVDSPACRAGICGDIDQGVLTPLLDEVERLRAQADRVRALCHDPESQPWTYRTALPWLHPTALRAALDGDSA